MKPQTATDMRRWQTYLIDQLRAKYKGKPHEERCVRHHRRRFSSTGKCRLYAEKFPDEYALFVAKERMGLL